MRLHSIALRNLRRRKARAAFLIIGLLIGVATIVTLLSLTRSMTGEARAGLESYGANVVVTPQSRDVALSYGGTTVGGVSVGADALSDADLARIEEIPARDALSVVAPKLVGPVRVKGERVLLMGVRPDDEFRLKRWWSVDAGRPPADGRELVAGAAAADALGLQMGDYVRIAGRRFTVTGILRPTGAQEDDLLIAELDAARQVLDKPGEVTLIEIAVSYARAPVDEVVSQLSAALPKAEVSAMQEAVATRLHAINRFRDFSYAIIGVVIAIETLVVFLTMMGSVSERIHEIGVFRAIGFRRVHITRLIVFEAVIAGSIAGVGGYVAGMATTYAVLPLLARGADVAWIPALGLAAVGLAVIIGALASLYPALHAGKLDPTEALRAL